MDSVFQLVAGAAGLLIGLMLLVRARPPRPSLSVLGGALLGVIRLLLVLGGFWTGGRLVGSDGRVGEPPATESPSGPAP